MLRLDNRISATKRNELAFSFRVAEALAAFQCPPPIPMYRPVLRIQFAGVFDTALCIQVASTESDAASNLQGRRDAVTHERRDYNSICRTFFRMSLVWIPGLKMFR
ncbi:hypothetical protein WA026_007646 [Henosepilachna vigintioctopunctata]|uniref:Uncharacterized protein n=1 Tax=Henosepilachna vigintioctopunctata TaxID=420089 RepID=A0AAW1U3N2_9CUCU